MLSDKNKETLFSEFPNVKLSYENIIHKKVYNSDVVLAIPVGKKCFAWFTEYNNQNVCFIIELDENKKMTNIKITNVCFKSDLSYGTIFYGTSFVYFNRPFFTIEDIFYYKGNNISQKNWLEKFTLFKTIMKEDISQIAYNNHFTVFGLPILSNNIDDLKQKISGIHYKIHSIQFKLYNKINNFLYMSFYGFNNVSQMQKMPDNIKTVEPKNNIKNNANSEKIYDKKYEQPNIRHKNINTKETNFKIKASIQNDIYHLYCRSINSSKDIYYDIAYIPSFTTSVMMNKLFRNIKENINLDKLEESDDEEEFENEKEDRHVNLLKSYNMICSFNYKFKKWVPLRIAHANLPIAIHEHMNKC